MSLFSPFYLNLPKVDFFICFCMKTKLYWNKLGIFSFSPPREIFPVIYIYNFCIKCHLLIYGYIKVQPVINPWDQILNTICYMVHGKLSNAVNYMGQKHFMLYKIYWRLKYCKMHYIWLHCILKYWINQLTLIIQSNNKIWIK